MGGVVFLRLARVATRPCKRWRELRVVEVCDSPRLAAFLKGTRSCLAVHLWIIRGVNDKFRISTFTTRRLIAVGKEGVKYQSS